MLSKFHSKIIGRDLLVDSCVISILSPYVFFLSLFQSRQILEREFNNLLAIGTDRRLDEVSLSDNELKRAVTQMGLFYNGFGLDVKILYGYWVFGYYNVNHMP